MKRYQKGRRLENEIDSQNAFRCRKRLVEAVAELNKQMISDHRIPLHSFYNDRVLNFTLNRV